MSVVANSLEFTDWLSMTCLRLLKNKMFIQGGFNTSFAPEYSKEFQVGETIRVPIPWRPIGGEGMDYNPEPIERRSYTITVDRTPHVHFEWGSVEEALKLTRGREKIKEEILEPAMNTMKQKWEILAAQWAFIHTPNVVGQLGTDPSQLSTVGAVRQRMVELAGWEGKKIFAISPSVNTAMVGASQSLFHDGDQISRAFKDGYLGRYGGFDWQESMSLIRHTAGTWAGAVTLNGTLTSGATSMSVNCTSGDTFKAGDKIGFTGFYPTNPATRLQATPSVTASMFCISVLADVTASGSTATIQFTDTIYGPGDQYQNITAMPTNGTTLVLWPGTSSPSGKQGVVSLAINKDAFAFAGVKLANPTAVEIASQARDPETGLSVAFVRAFDPVSRKMVNRFDSLGGFGDFYARNCSVGLAGA
jgi:hypothetical protein